MKTKILFISAFIFILGCKNIDLKYSSYDQDPIKITPISDEESKSFPIYDRSLLSYSDGKTYIKLMFKENQGRLENDFLIIQKIANKKQLAYKSGLIPPFEPPALDLLWQARLHSEFHQPQKINIGDKTVWVISDIYCDQESHLEEAGYHQSLRICTQVLEIYKSNPSIQIVPDKLIPIAQKTYELPEVKLMREKKYENTLPIFIFDSPWEIETLQFDKDSRLNKIAFTKWSPNILKYLSGQEIIDDQLQGEVRNNLETALTDRLIEWKVGGMVSEFKKMPYENLKKLSVDIEKLLLRLDIKIRTLKDQADLEMQTSNTISHDLQQRIHLLDQRKGVLMSIVSTLKQAILSQNQEAAQ